MRPATCLGAAVLFLSAATAATQDEWVNLYADASHTETTTTDVTPRTLTVYTVWKAALPSSPASSRS